MVAGSREKLKSGAQNSYTCQAPIEAVLGLYEKILAFETSCDDTAVAIVDEAGVIWGEALIFASKRIRSFRWRCARNWFAGAYRQILLVTKEVFEQAKLNTKIFMR